VHKPDSVDTKKRLMQRFRRLGISTFQFVIGNAFIRTVPSSDPGRQPQWLVFFS
jgi:hypothetical protein